MTPSGDKIPPDFVPERSRGERVVAWWVAPGERFWLNRVRWLRVAGAVVVLAVIGYAAAAGVLYGWARWGQEIEGARFVDILLPTRWDSYRVARGESQIAAAKRSSEKGDYLEAFLFARAGVVSAPANRDGRLLLYDLLLAARRPADARRVMLEGLHFHSADPVLVKPLLKMLLQQQEDAHVVALARRYLPEMAPGADCDNLYTMAAATACFYRGNYDQAVDFLRANPRVAESREGRLLTAKIEWDRGYRELAMLQLRQMAEDLPTDAELHHEWVVKLRESGREDEARRSSLAFQIAFPALPGPRIELLYAYRNAGDTARVSRETGELLRDFPADHEALLALGDFASATGDVALARKISLQAGARGLPVHAFVMLTVETQIVARDFNGAIQTLRGYEADFPSLGRAYAGLFESLTAAAMLGKGEADGGGVYLNKYLGQPSLRAETLLSVANRFLSLGAEEPARKVLTRAVEIDPLDQAALSRLVELNLRQDTENDLALRVQSLVRMRRPAPDILRRAQAKLGGDRFLFSPESAKALEAIRGGMSKVAGEAGRN